MNSLYRYRARIDRDIKQTIRKLQEERAKAFAAQIEKAKKFSWLAILAGL